MIELHVSTLILIILAAILVGMLVVGAIIQGPSQDDN